MAKQEHIIRHAHILLVDDVPLVSESMRLFIESLGHSCEAFNDPIAAMEEFRSGPDRFDMVIADFSMPNMNGHELAGALTAIRADLPVFIHTAWPAGDLANGKPGSRQVRAYIEKPLKMADLSALIGEVLAEKAAGRGQEECALENACPDMSGA